MERKVGNPLVALEMLKSVYIIDGKDLKQSENERWTDKLQKLLELLFATRTWGRWEMTQVALETIITSSRRCWSDPLSLIKKTDGPPDCVVTARISSAGHHLITSLSLPGPSDSSAGWRLGVINDKLKGYTRPWLENTSEVCPGVRDNWNHIFRWLRPSLHRHWVCCEEYNKMKGNPLQDTNIPLSAISSICWNV